MDIESIYQFTKLMEKFKEIERFRGQYYWRTYPQRQRYESTADHSWRMALVFILIKNKMSEVVDSEKTLKMILIHDLPEIVSGDPSPLGEKGTGEDSHAYNPRRIKQKYEQELAAAKELFSQLPYQLGQELLALWVEFEEAKTYEAKVVQALDKWEAKLQVLQYTGGHMFAAHVDFTLKYRDEYFDFDPLMRQLTNRLTEDLHDSYREFEIPPIQNNPQKPPQKL